VDDPKGLDPDAFDAPFLERLGLVAELPRFQAAADELCSRIGNAGDHPRKVAS
jgi:hypothetical protein